MRALAPLVAAAAVGVAAPAAAAPPPARPKDGVSHLQQLIWRGRVVYCGGAHGRLVALTFDDGPGPYTDSLVAVLRRSHVRATFFMVGSRVAIWPAQARAAARVGVLGVHTWSHAHLPAMRPRDVKADLLRTQREILRRTNTYSSLFRPPYEETTRRVDKVAQTLNMLQVRWNVDAGDSLPGASFARTLAAVDAGLRPGAIVLLHDAHPWTASATAEIIRELRARHLKPVTLPDLLERDPPSPTERC